MYPKTTTKPKNIYKKFTNGYHIHKIQILKNTSLGILVKYSENDTKQK